MKQYIVHLSANYEMMAAMGDSFRNIENLCKAVLTEHEKIYGTRLPISLNSFVIEVLAHAYAYKVLRTLRKLKDLKIFRLLSSRACVIDCGDKNHDSNRWFWDGCSFLKPLIFLLMRKGI